MIEKFMMSIGGNKMQKFSFEENGINFDVVITENIIDFIENDFTHECNICGTCFSSHEKLTRCPNGCEGLIPQKVEEI
jgi:rubrerythrin